MEATPGQNLFLSLDVRLQDVAEAYFRDKVGSVVALDPNTGEILALVSSPSYDPNWFMRRVTSSEWSSLLENPDRPLQNRAIQNMYSPGFGHQAVPGVRGAGQGPRGSEHARLLSGSRRLLRPRLPMPQEGRPWVGQPAGRHQGLVRRVLLHAGPEARHRPHQRDRDAPSDSAGPRGSICSPRRRGLVPSEEWARAKRGARWYPSETISVAIGQGPAAGHLDAGRPGPRRTAGGRPPADAAPVLFLPGSPHARATALQGRVPERDGDLAGEARDRQRRDVGRRQRAGRNRLRLARRRIRDGGQDRDRAGRRPGDQHEGRRGSEPVSRPRLVRGLRPGGQAGHGRRRVRGKRRPRQPRRRSSGQGALRDALRDRASDAAGAGRAGRRPRAAGDRRGRGGEWRAGSGRDRRAARLAAPAGPGDPALRR